MIVAEMLTLFDVHNTTESMFLVTVSSGGNDGPRLRQGTTVRPNHGLDASDTNN